MHSYPVICGCARVSTGGQSVDAQIRALRAAGGRRGPRETASGAKTGGRQVRGVLAQLSSGDALMARRLDRLARPATP